MKKFTFWQRFRYWFDNLMSKGTASLLLLLAVITTFVVVTGGLLSVALGGALTEAGAPRPVHRSGSHSCTPSARV